MLTAEILTLPFFDESHRRLAADLAQWTHRELAFLRTTVQDEDLACQQIVQALGRGRECWLRYVVPTEYGGMFERLDVRSLCLIRETLARFSALADFAFAMQGLGSAPLTLFGTEAQKKAYLPKVCIGAKIAAFALSEREAGSDVSALATTAQFDGSHYILNGEKTWISNAGIADFYCVFARSEVAPGAKGLSAFVVDAKTPGFFVTERIHVTSPHPLGTISFENCRIPESHRIGDPGQGFKIAMATLDVFRSTVGAAALGLARRAIFEALARVSTREVFGRPLGDFQLTQQRIAQMATELDASALLIYRAAWKKDAGAERITKEAAMAKWYATEAAQRIIDSSMQLLGGLGVISDSPVERLYRDIRPLRIYEGTSEIQQIIIASQVLREFAERHNLVPSTPKVAPQDA